MRRHKSSTRLLLVPSLALAIGAGLYLSYPKLIQSPAKEDVAANAKALADKTAIDLRDKARKAQAAAEATPGPGGVNLPSDILTPKE